MRLKKGLKKLLYTFMVQEKGALSTVIERIQKLFHPIIGETKAPSI